MDKMNAKTPVNPLPQRMHHVMMMRGLVPHTQLRYILKLDAALLLTCEIEVVIILPYPINALITSTIILPAN